MRGSLTSILQPERTIRRLRPARGRRRQNIRDPVPLNQLFYSDHCPSEGVLTAVSGFAKIHLVIAEYLADAPYRFSIAFGREKFEQFWGATVDNTRILAERRKWLAEDEGKYLVALPEARDLLEEASELGIESGTLTR